MRSGPGKTAKNKKLKKEKKSTVVSNKKKEIECDEPHPAPNEKTQPIQWTERPTGALVAVNSLWPVKWGVQRLRSLINRCYDFDLRRDDLRGPGFLLESNWESNDVKDNFG